MSSSPASGPGNEPAPVATALSDAGFLRVTARPTGDAVAAAGLLARAARASGTAFHVRTTRDATIPDGDGRALAVGWDAPDAVSIVPGATPLSVRAADAIQEAGLDPDPVLALAGAFAAGSHPGADGTGALLEAAQRRDAVERRPGVALATADTAEGLAHSIRLRLPISGDTATAADLLAELRGTGASEGDVDGGELTPETRRNLASVVALDATEDAPPQAVAATERVLHPYATPTGPFETVGGFAEVLEATARADAGLAVALALDPGSVADAALDCWRRYAASVHALSDGAETARYDGVFVLRVAGDDGDGSGADTACDAATACDTAAALPTVARLAREFQSPEETVLAISADAAAAVGSADGPAVDEVLASAVGDVSDEHETTGWHEAADARFDGDATAVIDRFREGV
jgi:hypothetical protein